MAWLSFDYNEELVDLVKAFGGQWNRLQKEWYVTDDNLMMLVGAMGREFPDSKPRIRNGQPLPSQTPNVFLNPALRDYQQKGVLRALGNKSQLFAYEMGLGKTATVLETIKHQYKEGQKIVVVTTGINRHTWKQQLQQWWPHFPGEIREYTPTEKAKYKKAVAKHGADKTTSPVHMWVTSYNLLSDFVMTPEERGFGVLPDIHEIEYLVFDEAHNLSNFKSGRHKDADKLAKLSPAQVFMLTGTPARDRLYDIHGLLRIIQPDHWGNWYSFIKRYCVLKANEYSEWNIVGMNEARMGELQFRLGQIMHRITKQEVKDQLPPFSFIPVFIDEPKKGTKRLEDVTDIEAFMLQSGYNKLDYTLDWIKDYQAASEDRPLCVVMYHYELADKVYEQLGGAECAGLFYANGRQSPDERIKTIQEAVSAGSRALLLVTMESVKTGINELKAFSRVLYGELHWSPEVVTQSMARFHRLDSPEPVEAYAIIMRGTKDEEMAAVLSSKMNEMERVVRSGSLEDKLRLSLIQDQVSPEALNDAWTQVKAVAPGEYD